MTVATIHEKTDSAATSRRSDGPDALQGFRDAHARFWGHSRECARCQSGNAGLSYSQQARGAGCPEAWPLFKELQRAQKRAYP